ncbi:MAG: hypothetical protein ACU0B9_18655 [Limimaricola soesokkakensis]|uniref:hypothetical protein n=1 Tax=Limimaricola soesokkakensis TaxID=1343159 RepID=UPI00405A3233
MAERVEGSTEETLDPQDWEAPRDPAHRVVDDAIGHVRNVRDRGVWSELPAEVKETFAGSVPDQPQPLPDVYRHLQRILTPYPMGS